MCYTIDNPSQVILTLPSRPETAPFGSQSLRSWTEVLEIDDEDIKYKGTPLNVLYEKNRKGWIIENPVLINRAVRGHGLIRKNTTGGSTVCFHFLP